MGKPESHLFTMEKKPTRCAKYVQDKVIKWRQLDTPLQIKALRLSWTTL